MIVPKVNINGTPRERLVAQNLDVADKLREAVELAKEAAPNGRDFQTCEAGRHAEARDEFAEKMRALDALVDHFYGLAIAISVQD